MVLWVGRRDDETTVRLKKEKVQVKGLEGERTK